MKWFFLLLLPLSQATSGPFVSKEDCVQALEETLAAVNREFYYPASSGICLRGVRRTKNGNAAP